MIKVLVDCRLESGKSGGVEQAIIGIARSIKESSISDIKFYWLVFEFHENWLMEHVPGNSEFIHVPMDSPSSKITKRIIGKLRKVRFFSKTLVLLRMHGPFKFSIENEPDIVKKLNPDLIHFPFQFGFRTDLPSIYQPHDLQHIHLRENFTSEEKYLRDLVFSRMIEQSSIVIVGNEWTKDDFTSNFPEHHFKFANVALYPQLLKEKPDSRIFENRYFLYPAAGWKHKNHVRLLKSFKLFLEEFPDVILVLTGAMVRDNPIISREIKRLGITDSVVRLGFVSPSDLANLYRNAAGVIIPTLFESASFPVWEAFQFGAPVAASNVTSIASQVGRGALLFDPYSESEIYQSLKQLICDKGGNATRSEIGKERVSLLSAKNTAFGYRYFYRAALGLEPDDLDRHWASTKFIF
jgi:glycosyltransferase involved in cell wall biosynthesis